MTQKKEIKQQPYPKQTQELKKIKIKKWSQKRK